MPKDTYHIQISVYVNCDSIHGAKAAASTLKGALEGYANTYMGDSLDEVIIDSVGKENTIGSDIRPKSTAK